MATRLRDSPVCDPALRWLIAEGYDSPSSGQVPVSPLFGYWPNDVSSGVRWVRAANGEAMTTETHLVTELGMLNVRAQGPAIAGIWLVTGGSEFPRAGWNDFVVVVLGWWSSAILRLLENNSGMERVHFMDGPYSVEVSKAQSGRLQLRMFAGPSGGRAVAVAEADIKRFVSELASQARKLLDECRLREWWSPDADALESQLHDLDRELDA